MILTNSNICRHGIYGTHYIRTSAYVAFNESQRKDLKKKTIFEHNASDWGNFLPKINVENY
jgi:hypothetical protein